MARDDSWETVIEAFSSTEGQPGVRRLKVPGGWLYQVEHYVLVKGHDKVVHREWHPPVFVQHPDFVQLAMEVKQRP